MTWRYTLENRELQWICPKNIFYLKKKKGKLCNSSLVMICDGFMEFSLNVFARQGNRMWSNSLLSVWAPLSREDYIPINSF